MHQKMEVQGDQLMIARANGVVERHQFASAENAAARLGTVAQALDWTGTPFRDCTDVRGPNGGVDCAMLLVRAFVDSGRLAPFDPRPYPTQWHNNQQEERFLDWVEKKLGGRQVETPRVGDVVIYHYGRCHAQGGIIINSDEIVHAYKKGDVCRVSWMRETELCFLRNGKPRPARFYEVGS